MLAIRPLPAFEDNYIWLLQHGDDAAVVDPGDAAPVLAALQIEALHLRAILITHHHRDHTGGIAALRAAWPQAVVYGPAGETIAGVDRHLHDGDSLDVLGARFTVLDVPGHTRGHIAYYAAAESTLFCGDTLFAGGCGRLFEGTPQQMTASLTRLRALPGDTCVYCAHEYTLANLGFARLVEPDNAALPARIERDRATRARDEPTVPPLLALERATNPFLRFDEPALLDAVAAHTGQRPTDDAASFWATRHWKDTEYD